MALAIASSFSPYGAHAQEIDKKSKDSERLKEVEVVGTSPLPGIGIEEDKLPYDVQSINAEALYRSQSMNLTDFMSRNLSGVNINEVQGSPFQADITYRGFRLSGILGSPQGLSVYLDGVRVNEPFGDVINWDMIPEAAINNVTLVPGSNPIYGLNTLGGALAFTTKSGLTAPGTEVKLQAGSFGRMRADVAYGSKSDDGYHSFISATGFREDGWRDYSSGQLGNVFAKVGRQQDDSKWDLSLLVGRSSLLGNGLLPSYSYGPNGTGSAAGGMYETNRRWVYTHTDRTRNELNQVIFNLQRLLDDSTELALNAYVRNSGRRTAGGDAEREEDGGAYENEAVLNSTKTQQTSYGAGANLTKLLDRHQLTLGGAVDASGSTYGGTQQGCGEPSLTRGVEDCAGAVRDEAKVKGNTFHFGIFGADTIKVAEGTHLTAAARFNHSRVDNTLTSFYTLVGGEATRRDLLGLDPETQRERFTYNSFNPSLGISHQLAPAVTVFGNVGRSNRVPTTIELGCASPANPCRLPTGLQADPYLRQVIAQTIELGTRWRFTSDSEMTLAVYRSDNTNDILFRNVDQTGLGYFDNFSKTRRQGIDVGVRTIIENIMVSGNYNYLDATYQDTAELFGGIREIEITPGNKIAGLPEHTFKLNVDWRAMPKLVLGGTVMGTSSITTQGNEDGQIGSENGSQALDVKVKGYTLLHLHANYEADKGLDYFARVNNVFDTRFESYGMMAMSMFNANGSPIDPNPNPSPTGPNVSRFVAPGAPRNFMVGLRYRF